jgi:hypothetical protein
LKNGKTSLRLNWKKLPPDNFFPDPALADCDASAVQVAGAEGGVRNFKKLIFVQKECAIGRAFPFSLQLDAA